MTSGNHMQVLNAENCMANNDAMIHYHYIKLRQIETDN